MMPRRRARPPTTSWLFFLAILADSSRESAPHSPNRLRCWAVAECVLRHTFGITSRRRTRGRSAGFASASEVTDEPQLETRYCPAESRFKLASEHLYCERIFVKVKNSSGVVVEVFRVNSDGQEVLELTADPSQNGVVAACRGHIWRARASSPGASGRLLLSEVNISPYLPLAGATGADGLPQTENAAGDTFLWEVPACVGFALPESFAVSSSLGRLGLLELSREAKATAHPTPDIEGLVSLTLEEAFRGKDVRVTVLRRVPCPVCHGFGAASLVSCDRCGGSGKRLYDIHLTNADDTPPRDSCRFHYHGTGTATAENVAEAEGDASVGGLKLSNTIHCAKCMGSGKVPAPQTAEGSGYCTQCAGARFVETETDLILSIPAGVEKGQTEVYEGQGHVDLDDLIDAVQQELENERASADGQTDGQASEASESPGDPTFSPPQPDSTPSTSKKAFFAALKKKKLKTGNFRLTVDVLEHPVFSRGDDGADMHTSIEISLEEALMGFTREITALDGSMVSVRRTSRTLPGMVLRFPGLGMPISVPSDGKRSSTYTEHITRTSPSAKHTAAAAETHVAEAGSTVTFGAAAGQGRREGARDGRAERNTAFGDLLVKVSIALPAGMRDDRSKLFGAFLKGGAEEAKEEEEREGGGEWRDKRRGWRRGERRRRAENAADTEGSE